MAVLYQVLKVDGGTLCIQRVHRLSEPPDTAILLSVKKVEGYPNVPAIKAGMLLCREEGPTREPLSRFRIVPAAVSV